MHTDLCFSFSEYQFQLHIQGIVSICTLHAGARHAPTQSFYVDSTLALAYHRTDQAAVLTGSTWSWSLPSDPSLQAYDPGNNYKMPKMILIMAGDHFDPLFKQLGFRTTAISSSFTSGYAAARTAEVEQQSVLFFCLSRIR